MLDRGKWVVQSHDQADIKPVPLQACNNSEFAYHYVPWQLKQNHVVLLVVSIL